MSVSRVALFVRLRLATHRRGDLFGFVRFFNPILTFHTFYSAYVSLANYRGRGDEYYPLAEGRG